LAGAILRFAQTGAGSVKALHGFHPPQFRLRVGDWRVRFHDHGDSIEILRVTHRKDAYQ
jgi:mRNA-degrading endonuclease RelE of RelBE toxin-antitoxin system